MAIKKKWKFQTSGITNNDLNERIDENNSQNSILPIGISLPVIFSNKPDDFLEMNYTINDELNDSIRNIIYTNLGERLCFPDLGVDLKSVITQNNDLNQTIDIISTRIKNSLLKYIPGISINSITANYSVEDNRKYKIPVVIININYVFYESEIHNIDEINVQSSLGHDVVQKSVFLKIKLGLNN